MPKAQICHKAQLSRIITIFLTVCPKYAILWMVILCKNTYTRLPITNFLQKAKMRNRALAGHKFSEKKQKSTTARSGIASWRGRSIVTPRDARTQQKTNHAV